MHKPRWRFAKPLLVAGALGACVTVALFASSAGARPQASIQACALLPDTKSSTRYTLFDAPYLKAAFKKAKRLRLGPQRARQPDQAEGPGPAVPRAGREGDPARPARPGFGCRDHQPRRRRRREGDRLRPPGRGQQGLVLRLLQQPDRRQAPGQGPRRGLEEKGDVLEAPAHRPAERRHQGQQRQAVQAGLRLDPQPALRQGQAQEGGSRRPVDGLESDQGPRRSSIRCSPATATRSAVCSRRTMGSPAP